MIDPAGSEWIDRERAACRRPIAAAEVPHLERLGGELRRCRRVAGLSRGRLAVSAELSPRHVERIERGSRRTRASTLKRLATALVEGRPGCAELGPADALARRFAALAGPALAGESDYRTRVEKRRKARRSRGYRRFTYRCLIPLLEIELRFDAQLAARDRRNAKRREARSRARW